MARKTHAPGDRAQSVVGKFLARDQFHPCAFHPVEALACAGPRENSASCTATIRLPNSLSPSAECETQTSVSSLSAAVLAPVA